MEPAPRLERGTLAVRKPCSGQIELSGRKSGGTQRDSNPQLRGANAACSPLHRAPENWLRERELNPPNRAYETPE